MIWPGDINLGVVILRVVFKALRAGNDTWRKSVA